MREGRKIDRKEDGHRLVIGKSEANTVMTCWQLTMIKIVQAIGVAAASILLAGRVLALW
jgi:hypothetical protein